MTPRPQHKALVYRPAGKLEDKVALITGGDSGIGRAVAVLFAREGADVAIVYLPQEQSDAEETESAVVAEGRRCLLIPGDVCDCRTRREVRDHCALFTTEHIQSREHERGVFTDRFTVFRDDGKSIRVHVLRETDVSLMLSNFLTEIAEVLRQWFSGTWERSVRRGV